jgi:glucose/arabinose dehydrogenase
MTSSRVTGLAVVLLTATLALTAAPRPATAQVPPFSFGDDPDAFQVTVFAADLPFPYGMVELDDGSLLVATSSPVGSGYFDSIGQVRRLVDGDGDGVADDTGTIVFDGLPGAVTALSRADDLFFVTSTQYDAEQIAVLRAGASPDAPLDYLGSFDFAFPAGQQHTTFALAVHPSANAIDKYDLYFNVGSAANWETGGSIAVSGLVTGTVESASIYRVTVDNSGRDPVFSRPRQIASGLRNAAGIAVDPATGDLYFEDNGIDTPGDEIEALSADELNVIPAAKIGGVVEDFGFPDSYVAYRTGEEVGDARVPLVAFQPIDGSESEGPVEIAFAPPDFPPGLNDGVFVGFHGQWDSVGEVNEENPLVYVDLTTGEYRQVVSNDESFVGHLDGLLATDDALYVADLTGPGSLGDSSPAGVIYRIQTT